MHTQPRLGGAGAVDLAGHCSVPDLIENATLMAGNRALVSLSRATLPDAIHWPPIAALAWHDTR